MIIIKVNGNDREAARFVHRHAAISNVPYSVTFEGRMDHFHFSDTQFGNALQKLLTIFLDERRQAM